MIRWVVNTLSQIPKMILTLVSFALVLVVSVLDYWSGYEIYIAIVYLVPVSFAAWFIGRNTGVGISLVSAVVWQLTNKLAGAVLSSPVYYAWNTVVCIVAFSIFAVLLHKLRVALEHERELSRTDPLTGAMNRRAFYEVFANELLQAQRYEHPLTIAYLDLDGFKVFNDRFGHSAGDTLLRTVSSTLKSVIRNTDTVARLGGDEFAILLPDTDRMGAKKALTKTYDDLHLAIGRAGWPITFSIGAIMCSSTTSMTLEDLLRDVDQVMYSIKKTGKNGILLDTHTR